MAIIKCPGCNNAISDLAKNCPFCGYDVEAHLKENKIETHIYDAVLKPKKKVPTTKNRQNRETGSRESIKVESTVERIKCPKCSKDVVDSLEFCIYCGCCWKTPDVKASLDENVSTGKGAPKDNKKMLKKILLYVGLVVGGFLILYTLYQLLKILFFMGIAAIIVIVWWRFYWCW